MPEDPIEGNKPIIPIEKLAEASYFGYGLSGEPLSNSTIHLGEVINTAWKTESEKLARKPASTFELYSRFYESVIRTLGFRNISRAVFAEAVRFYRSDDENLQVIGQHIVELTAIQTIQSASERGLRTIRPFLTKDDDNNDDDTYNKLGICIDRVEFLDEIAVVGMELTKKLLDSAKTDDDTLGFKDTLSNKLAFYGHEVLSRELGVPKEWIIEGKHTAILDWVQDFILRNGQSPGLGDVAKAFKIDTANEDGKRYLQNLISLFENVTPPDDPLGDTFSDVHSKATITEMLKRLKADERAYVIDQQGFSDEGVLTISQIAAKHGVSERNVIKKIDNAKRKMRHPSLSVKLL